MLWRRREEGRDCMLMPRCACSRLGPTACACKATAFWPPTPSSARTPTSEQSQPLPGSHVWQLGGGPAAESTSGEWAAGAAGRTLTACFRRLGR